MAVQWKCKSDLRMKNVKVAGVDTKTAPQFLPSLFVTEWLILHVSPIVSPLPFLLLPIVHATNPFVMAQLVSVLQIFPQPSVSEFQGFSKLAISVFALEVCVQPIFFRRWKVIAIVADFCEFRWAEGVHATSSSQRRFMLRERLLIVGLEVIWWELSINGVDSDNQ